MCMKQKKSSVARKEFKELWVVGRVVKNFTMYYQGRWAGLKGQLINEFLGCIVNCCAWLHVSPGTVLSDLPQVCLKKFSQHLVVFFRLQLYEGVEAPLKKLRRTITALGALLDIEPILDCINVQITKAYYRIKIAHGVMLVSQSDLRYTQGCLRIDFLEFISLTCLRLVSPTEKFGKPTKFICRTIEQSGIPNNSNRENWQKRDCTDRWKKKK